MPAKLITRKREYQPAAEQEQAAPVARRPSPEADEDESMETGRPYQAFVEREARKYWGDMMEQRGSLVKPNPQELRAAAMPILLEGLRKRGWVRFLPPTVKAHMAVNAMHMHGADSKVIPGTYYGPYPVSDHIQALLQYMEDTRLAPQEIPLPEHEGRQHPPIYYYIDPITRQATPRKDALMRAAYVRFPWACDEPVTWDSRIHPSTDPDGGPPPVVLENELEVYYRLEDLHRYKRLDEHGKEHGYKRGEFVIEICLVVWNEGRHTIFERRLSQFNFITPRWLEAYEPEPMEAGQRLQAFTKWFWQDMVERGNLAKPNQQELRAAAMPILIQGLRRRSGTGILPPTVIARLAVDIMHQHAAERGETTEPYTGPYPSPDHIEALTQYAADTRLLPREIPLPEHEGPQHPPIYYYIDPVTRQPTPRKDALIRAEYVRDPGDGKPVTEASHIHPSTDRYGQPPPEVVERKSDSYYRLYVDRGETKTGICRIIWRNDEPDISEEPLSYYDFTVSTN